MKRTIAMILAVGMALALGACSGKKAPADDASLTQVLGKKAIVAGFDSNYEPLGFQREGGTYTGFDLDLAKEIAKRLKVTLNLQLLNASSARGELDSAGVDYLCNNLTLAEDGEKGLEKSDKILNSRVVVAVRMGSGVDSLSALEGKNVGVVPKTRAAVALDGKSSFKSKVTVVEQKDAAAALAALNDKKLDAIVVDETFVRNRTTEGASIVMLDEELASYDYCMLFREADGTLREKVNALLGEMAADGTLTKLSIKWFGADITTIEAPKA